MRDYWVGNRNPAIDDDNPVFWDRNLGIYDMGTAEDAALYMNGERRQMQQVGQGQPASAARGYQSVPLGIAGAEDEFTVPAAQRSLVRVGRYVLITLFNDLGNPEFNPPNIEEPGYSVEQVAELRHRMSTLVEKMREQGISGGGTPVAQLTPAGNESIRALAPPSQSGSPVVNPAGDAPFRQLPPPGRVFTEAAGSLPGRVAGGIPEAIRATWPGRSIQVVQGQVEFFPGAVLYGGAVERDDGGLEEVTVLEYSDGAEVQRQKGLEREYIEEWDYETEYVTLQGAGAPDSHTGDQAGRSAAVQSAFDQKLSAEGRVSALLVVHLALLGWTVSRQMVHQNHALQNSSHEESGQDAETASPAAAELVPGQKAIFQRHCRGFQYESETDYQKSLRFSHLPCRRSRSISCTWCFAHAENGPRIFLTRLIL